MYRHRPWPTRGLFCSPPASGAGGPGRNQLHFNFGVYPCLQRRLLFPSPCMSANEMGQVLGDCPLVCLCEESGRLARGGVGQAGGGGVRGEGEGCIVSHDEEEIAEGAGPTTLR